jgi:hypothetical protein
MYQHIRRFQFATLLIMILFLVSCFSSKTNAPKTKKLRHVVAFKFKPEVTHEQMQKTTEHFHSLKAEIPQIIEFEGGADIAFQKKNGKYTHCFVVTVNNEKDLAIYGGHPVHKAFSKSVDPLLAEVMVVDYWTE